MATISKSPTLLILSAVVVLLTSFFVIFSLAKEKPSQLPTSAKVDTTDWKTYLNSEHGFSLKYPQTLKIKESINANSAFFSNSNYSLSVYWNDGSDYDQWIGSIKEKIKSNQENIAKRVLSGHDVYLESRMSAEGIFERNAFIIGRPVVINIGVGADTRVRGNEEPEIYTKVEDLLDEILSTFKFTK